MPKERDKTTTMNKKRSGDDDPEPDPHDTDAYILWIHREQQRTYAMKVAAVAARKQKLEKESKQAPLSEDGTDDAADNPPSPQTTKRGKEPSKKGKAATVVRSDPEPSPAPKQAESKKKKTKAPEPPPSDSSDSSEESEPAEAPSGAYKKFQLSIRAKPESSKPPVDNPLVKALDDKQVPQVPLVLPPKKPEPKEAPWSGAPKQNRDLVDAANQKRQARALSGPDRPGFKHGIDVSRIHVDPTVELTEENMVLNLYGPVTGTWSFDAYDRAANSRDVTKLKDPRSREAAVSRAVGVWFSKNNWELRCVKCHCEDLKDCVGVPCRACRRTGSVCYFRFCGIDDDGCHRPLRNRCTYLHDGLMLEIATAINRLQPELSADESEQVVTEWLLQHQWRLPREYYDAGAPLRSNFKEFDVPPVACMTPRKGVTGFAAKLNTGKVQKAFGYTGSRPLWGRALHRIEDHVAQFDEKKKGKAREAAAARKIAADTAPKKAELAKQKRDLPTMGPLLELTNQEVQEGSQWANATEWKRRDAEGYRKAQSTIQDRKYMAALASATGMPIQVATPDSGDEKPPTPKPVVEQDKPPTPKQVVEQDKPTAPPGGGKESPDKEAPHKAEVPSRARRPQPKAGDGALQQWQAAPDKIKSEYFQEAAEAKKKQSEQVDKTPQLSNTRTIETSIITSGATTLGGRRIVKRKTQSIIDNGGNVTVESHQGSEVRPPAPEEQETPGPEEGAGDEASA
ncbi:hypothetical protein B0A55_12985 [Friedmanniomyces simplex]|uniref:Uncharacterized protein n=1 Tax=Friedmanniomyces simplex TaxID=329884 RepID=A0A4U0WHG8_9PEZI|nr:hypothetical protein B0A55_12985 [Friedmanniomyces simplex]